MKVWICLQEPEAGQGRERGWLQGIEMDRRAGLSERPWPDWVFQAGEETEEDGKTG